jgi:hypothetical protein
MKKTDYGAYIFEGGEQEDVESYMWACFRNMPFLHRIKMAWWIIIRHTPSWVEF